MTLLDEIDRQRAVRKRRWVILSLMTFYVMLVTLLLFRDWRWV